MEKRLEKSEGLGYYNLARGLGITLIVLGHSMKPVLGEMSGSYPFQKAGTVLGGGIIAAFFMISGFGFYKRTPRKCFEIQKKILLKPYIMVGSAVLLTKVLLAILKKKAFFKKWRGTGSDLSVGIECRRRREFYGNSHRIRQYFMVFIGFVWRVESI